VDPTAFNLEEHPSVSVLSLTGEFSQLPWEEVESLGSQVVAHLDPKKRPALVVDLSKLNYIGSAQIAMLVRVWKSIRPRQGKMAVQVEHDTVRKVLTMAGLDKLWDLTESRDDAYRSVGVRPPVDSTHVNNGVAIPAAVAETVDVPVVSSRESGIIFGIGAVALLAGIGGLAADIAWKSFANVDARVVLVTQFSLAVIALFAGVWCSIRGRRTFRVLGVALIFTSTLLIAVEVLHAQGWLKQPALQLEEHERIP
jgi:anti-anti-sigma factor